MEGQGIDPANSELKEKMKKSAGPAYVQMFILALVQAYVFAHVLWAFDKALTEKINAVVAGLQGGFYLWLGFVLPVKYGDKLWSGKKFNYIAVDLGYYLVQLLAMGMILSCWR